MSRYLYMRQALYERWAKHHEALWWRALANALSTMHRLRVIGTRTIKVDV